MNHPHETDVDGAHVAKAISIALEKLGGMNVRDIAEASGALYHADGSLEIRYFGSDYLIKLSEGEFIESSGSACLTAMDRAVILHYLMTATGRKPSGNLISFSSLSPMRSFSDVARSDSRLNELERVFGENATEIYKTLKKLPGEKSTQGDASIKIFVLPRVSFIYVIWEGEDKIIPPEANVLFDSTITDYLPMEDIGVLSGIVATRIVNVYNEL